MELELQPKEFDRFELEDRITTAWSGLDDMTLIIESIKEGIGQDEILTLLEGWSAIQEMKHQRVWQSFREGVAAGGIK